MCRIPLPFAVKPDFDEDEINFSGSETTNIYVIRFKAYEQRFAAPKKKLIVRNINSEHEKKSSAAQGSTPEPSISESKSDTRSLISAVSS